MPEQPLADARPELPPTYYLTNFELLIDDVMRRYRPLLDQVETDWYRIYRTLSLPARCLYVRLLSRKGPWFRLARLSYAEIGDLQPPLAELASAGMLEVNGALPAQALFQLFTRQELCSRFSHLPGQGRKPELVSKLCEEAGDAEGLVTPAPEWIGEEQIVRPLFQEVLDRFRLLFFGNLDQDLSDFVLADLGLIRYESYGLDGQATAFRSRPELDQLHQAILLRRQVEESITEDDQSALAAAAEILAKATVASIHFKPALRVRDKTLNSLGRYFERRGDFQQAHKLYEASRLPPARERMARMYYAQDDAEAALALCEEILAAPWDEQEATCARRIRDRCLRVLGRPRDVAPRVRIATRTLVLPTPPAGVSVEGVALQALLEERSGDGFYVENWAFNALLGLWLWPVVFAPVEDAFYHPFQHGPRDLYERVFLEKRRHLLDQAEQLLADPAEFPLKLKEVWDAKQGLANPFVGWSLEHWPVLERALAVIPRSHLRLIFDRMLADLRNHSSGFPDLLLFGADGSYELVEVKGPGDRLQDHQTRWLEFFKQHAIPASVLHIAYA